MDRKKMLGLTLSAPFAATAAGRVEAAVQMDALYERARAEGALSLYTGGAAGNSTATVKAFKARFPGIDVTVNGDYSNITDLKIDRQLRDNAVECDVASLQTVQDFVRWDHAGEIAHFEVDGFGLIPAAYKGAGGAFVASNINPLAYAVNSELVGDAEAPRSALDFLKPRFRGKVVTCYPHDDDATLYLYYTLVQKYGWHYIDRLMENEPMFYEGHLGVARAIALGDKWVSFDIPVRTGSDQKKTGPIAIYFSPIESTPVFYNTLGILKRAPHPNAARLFVNWLLSPRSQIATRGYSARPDVPQPKDLPPLRRAHLAIAYKAFLTNTPLITALRARFLKYTGPVVNKS
jgi:ABC-type Fe3+ transport system substrate-binding protein